MSWEGCFYTAPDVKETVRNIVSPSQDLRKLSKTKDSLIYSRHPNCTIGLKYSRDSSDGNKGLIYSCGGCETFKYFKFLFATVWKGLYTVAIFQQLYKRDYIQLVLSISYIYTRALHFCKNIDFKVPKDLIRCPII